MIDISCIIRGLTGAEHNKGMEKMVKLLKETNALQEPILRIQTGVEETKITVEETKRTVEDIFKSIKGQSPHLITFQCVLIFK